MSSPNHLPLNESPAERTERIVPQAPRLPQPAPLDPVLAAPTHRRIRWGWVIAGVLFVVVCTVIAQSAAQRAEERYPRRGDTAPIATIAPSAAPLAAAAPAVTEQPTPAAPAGPLTAFQDGVWEVGVDIAPGKYKGTPLDGGLGCYYARLKANDGSFGDIIDNGIVNGPVTVTISSKDGYFETARCGWVLAS